MSRSEAIAAALAAVREQRVAIASELPIGVTEHARLTRHHTSRGWSIIFSSGYVKPRNDADKVIDIADIVLVEVYEPSGEVVVIPPI